MDNRVTCRECYRIFVDDEDDDSFESGLCYACFEDRLEQFEEDQRRRIAEENEY